jgi:hypothetical protein
MQLFHRKLEKHAKISTIGRTDELVEKVRMSAFENSSTKATIGSHAQGCMLIVAIVSLIRSFVGAGEQRWRLESVRLYF